MDKSTPTCCLSEKKWLKLRSWANQETNQMVKSLKEHMKLKTATDEFLTVPLIDTLTNSKNGVAQNQTAKMHPQPITYFLQIGSSYSPISSSTSSVGGRGGRGHGNASTFTPTSASPILNYHTEFGIFIPNRLDNSRGLNLNVGLMGFQLKQSGTTISYASGTAANVDQTATTSCTYLELAPHYTFASRKKTNHQLYTSIGLVAYLTNMQNMKDAIGPDLQFNYGRNGCYLYASLSYAVNNMYGTSSGFRPSPGGLDVQPLFMGLGFAFYPQQNKWVKKVVGK